MAAAGGFQPCAGYCGDALVAKQDPPERPIETRPNRPGFFSVKSFVCSKLALRRDPCAVLRILEHRRAGSESRGRDESDGESNNRHELLHSTSPTLIRTSCGAERDDHCGHARKETANLQRYSRRATINASFQITSS